MIQSRYIALAAGLVAVLGFAGCGGKQRDHKPVAENNLVAETPPEDHEILPYSKLQSMYGPSGIKPGISTHKSIRGWFGEPAYIDQSAAGETWIYYIWKGEYESGYSQAYGQTTPYYQVDIHFNGDVVSDFDVTDLMAR